MEKRPTKVIIICSVNVLTNTLVHCHNQLMSQNKYIFKLILYCKERILTAWEVEDVIEYTYFSLKLFLSMLWRTCRQFVRLQ